MLFDKNNPCYRAILFSHRIILFFRRSQCSLTKTTLLQNHSSLANRTILFVRRSRCFLTKTTPAAEPFYPRAKHNRILSQITMLFDKNNPCCRTMLFSRRTILFFRRLRCYSLWQKQPCCRTILFSHRIIIFFRRSQCSLTKTTLLQNHSSLANRTILFFRKSRRYPLWHKQPCCRTILSSRKTQSYSFADDYAF